MLERTFTADHVVPAVQAIFSNRAVVIKHCDLFTKGIPDLTVTVMHQTFWLEMKVLRKGDKNLPEEVVARKQQLQHETLKRLAKASGGRAVYVIRDERHGTFYWCDPADASIRNDEHRHGSGGVEETLLAMFRCKNH